jgi:CheY-like chemotaxis protein
MKKINCILLIDDDIDDNEFHEIVIMKAGVCNNVRTAKNGIQGLEYIMNSAKPELQDQFPRPNLIFLDINMPRMNGFEFLEEYNKLDDSLKAEVMICMLTTSLNPEDRKKANEINAVTDFLEKPLTVDALTKIINNFF